MKHSIYLSKLLLILLFTASLNQLAANEKIKVKTTISKSELQNKIKGGWAGQVIGCTFGGPTEFKYNGTMIQDYQTIPWDNSRCKWYYENVPGLYDDVYMDLTFVDVFEKEGLDAPAASHAKAFANAGYFLWHANQAARYNILNGINPPESGNWLNNPHAEDIDFQIEADFAGLMSPGMVNTATKVCDKVGHIMNYGDGWYGGVYVAAMYSLTFVSGDINFVVTEALKSIPKESTFYQCMSDVIRWKKEYPNDWKRTWFECEKKWSSDIGCPDGVFRSFNIDAKINAAYIIIGLLYGEGDFGKTMEISARCGQDSDCNPASAGGILGAMLGYDAIPEYWKAPVYPVEEMNFKYTTMSLNNVYKIGNKHALEMLKKNGAVIKGDEIEIPYQKIEPANLEIGFKGHYPVERRNIGKIINEAAPELNLDFKGNGFVLTGQAQKTGGLAIPDYVFDLELYIDGKLVEKFKMSTDFITRRHDIAWKYQLPEGKHQVKVHLLNPRDGYKVSVVDVLLYSSINNSTALKTDKK
jgi:hypothetical protein